MPENRSELVADNQLNVVNPRGDTMTAVAAAAGGICLQRLQLAFQHRRLARSRARMQLKQDALKEQAA